MKTSTKQDKAVISVMRRILHDPRIAYLIGPMSQTYEDVTDAYADLINKDPNELRAEIEKVLETEAWPS
jgi:3-deoxy-D-arabino-heptulosonate 7-phosphate (DAHP) synthase